jgi:hypothetical protein
MALAGDDAIADGVLQSFSVQDPRRIHRRLTPELSRGATL